MAVEEAADLSGRRIIVVEDDYLLAAEICSELRRLGATVLGPAPTPFYATQLIGRRKIDAAVLDVRLHGATVFEVADLLRSQGVPMLFVTALGRQALPPRFRESRLLEKPADFDHLVSEVVAMTRQPAPIRAATPRFSVPHPSCQVPAQTFARSLARSLRSH